MVENLDDILDDALDDLDESDHESNDISAKMSETAKFIAEKSEARAHSVKQKTEEELEKSSENNPFNFDLSESALEDMMKNLGGTDMLKNLEDSFKDMNLENMSETDVLKELTKNVGSVDGVAEMGEKMMEKMFGDFNKAGDKKGFNNQVNSIMSQIVGKEIMYEPVKAMSDKFPEWLADNKETISVEDFERFSKQFEYFRNIVKIYDTEPNRTDKVIKLMQDMQQFGNPPKSLVEDVAPGLNMQDIGKASECPQM